MCVYIYIYVNALYYRFPYTASHCLCQEHSRFGLEESYAHCLDEEPQWIRSFSNLISTVIKLHDCPKQKIWLLTIKKSQLAVSDLLVIQYDFVVLYGNRVTELGKPVELVWLGWHRSAWQWERPERQSTSRVESRRTVHHLYESNPQPRKKQL